MRLEITLGQLVLDLARDCFSRRMRNDRACSSGGMVSSRPKSVNYVRAFWNALPEGGVVRKLARGPTLWRAGWQRGQEAPRSGGRGWRPGDGPAS
jgi:hypothetical protein